MGALGCLGPIARQSGVERSCETIIPYHNHTRKFKTNTVLRNCTCMCVGWARNVAVAHLKAPLTHSKSGGNMSPMPPQTVLKVICEW